MTRYSDFHIHPDFSIDAIGTIMEYCERALELGLYSICFTTHYDTNPNRLHLDDSWKIDGKRIPNADWMIKRYIREIEDARNHYQTKGLKVFCGLEIDYCPDVHKEVMRINSLFNFDFLIGAVHCVQDLALSEPDEAKDYFKGNSADDMVIAYIELLKLAAESKLFSCIAHLDYYARYMKQSLGYEYKIPEIQFMPVFAALNQNDVGIEINTSPYKRGIADFHPSRPLLDAAIRAGVKIASIGSDAHRPDRLGRGVPEAYKFISTLGISPVFPRI